MGKKKTRAIKRPAERIRSFAAKLEKNIDEAETKIAKLKSLSELVPKMKGGSGKRLARYSIERSLQYFNAKEMYFMSIACEFYQHFPELRPKER